MQNNNPGDQRDTELEEAVRMLVEVMDRGFDSIKQIMDRMLGRDGGGQ